MVYVDPAKLQAYQMSPMDVVRAVNNANLILPSGDVKIGPFDYTIFTNSQFRNVPDINRIPLKTVGRSMVRGRATSATPRTRNQIQTNIVQVDGQRVGLPAGHEAGRRHQHDRRRRRHQGRRGAAARHPGAARRPTSCSISRCS